MGSAGRGSSGQPGRGRSFEPDLGLDDAADTWVDALRETLKPLGDELICPLSGGRDSRMLLSAAAIDRGRSR